MTYEEVIDRLAEIAELRMPDWPEDVAASVKIEGLEDHLLETARARGILEAARIQLENAYEEIDDRWRDLAGYEPYLRGKPKTQAEIDEAKRHADKDLFTERRLCQKLLRQVGNQTRRLEKDDAAASRCYTMLTGS